MNVQYQIIYWRDIPAHLRVKQGRKRLSHPLPEIFQQTVYRAAYRGKAITGNAFQEPWHARGWFDYEGEGSGERSERELEAVARAIAASVIEAYDEKRLNQLALNKGYDLS